MATFWENKSLPDLNINNIIDTAKIYEDIPQNPCVFKINKCKLYDNMSTGIPNKDGINLENTDNININNMDFR